MEVEADAPEICDRCGVEAAGYLGEEALCETCCHEASSCCGLFGYETDSNSQEAIFTTEAQREE